jgi:hypothetical protein
VLAHLARQPVWIVATSLSFCALLLHALALHLGSIALVQPLMLVGVVLAVPARSLLVRETPGRQELQAVGLTALGLVVFVLSARSTRPEHGAAAVTTGGFVLGCTLLGLAALRLSGSGLLATARLRAGALAVGAGLMFGASAGLLKVLGTVLAGAHSHHFAAVAVLLSVVVTGLLGTAMNQRAYQLAPLSCSLPLVNVTDIAVAVLFGAVVLGQPPAHTPTLVCLQVAALCCVGVGLSRIARLRAGSPAVSPAVSPAASPTCAALTVAAVPR